MDETCELKMRLLSYIEFSESHTGDNLANELKKCVEEWEITDKIICLVSDNAAVRKCGWRHVPCFAHNLNLIVQHGV